MGRELAIALYLVAFKLVFTLFKRFPQQNKTVCVASFGDNIHYTAQALHLKNHTTIILQTSSCNYPFAKDQATIIPFRLAKPLSYLRGIYHLATGKNIVVDNYYGFLAVCPFSSGVRCFQVWHAAGAIKSFGLTAPSTLNRSKKAQERFQRVYDRFEFIVVGSDRMSTVFRKCFGVRDDSRFLRTGIPRTDFFFERREEIFIEERDRKIILYAPTFREDELPNYQLQLDIGLLHEKLSRGYELWIKMHPAVNYEIPPGYEDFVKDVSSYPDTNELLLKADILLTDYSSIPFEFALLEKPIIFYAYDLDEYEKSQGFAVNYREEMPGPIAETTSELVHVLMEGNFDLYRNRLHAFAAEWNEYSVGDASEKLAAFLVGDSPVDDAP